jgi:hypothetical protein
MIDADRTGSDTNHRDLQPAAAKKHLISWALNRWIYRESSGVSVDRFRPSALKPNFRADKPSGAYRASNKIPPSDLAHSDVPPAE